MLGAFDAMAHALQIRLCPEVQSIKNVEKKMKALLLVLAAAVSLSAGAENTYVVATGTGGVFCQAQVVVRQNVNSPDKWYVTVTESTCPKLSFTDGYGRTIRDANRVPIRDYDMQRYNGRYAWYMPSVMLNGDIVEAIKSTGSVRITIMDTFNRGDYWLLNSYIAPVTPQRQCFRTNQQGQVQTYDQNCQRPTSDVNSFHKDRRPGSPTYGECHLWNQQGLRVSQNKYNESDCR